MEQQRRVKSVLLTLAVAGAFVFAACGGNGSDTGRSPASPTSAGTMTEVARATQPPPATDIVATAAPTSTVTEESAAEIARPTGTAPPATPSATAPPASQPATATPTPEPAQADVDLAPALGSLDAWYNSEPVSLDQLRGEPVLLVFWASF